MSEILNGNKELVVHTLPEQAAQTHRPHNLQWCLLLLQLKDLPQRIHASVLSSGIQIAGTQWSTFFRRSLGLTPSSRPFAFSLSALLTSVTSFTFCAARIVAMRSSEGGKGNACNERRTWFVDEEEVRVEFGLVIFSETRRWALACLISETQHSRSSSEPGKSRVSVQQN